MDPAENPSFPQGVGGMDLPIPTQHASDLIIDDWLAPSFNASELTDFPDADVAAQLAAFSGRDFGSGIPEFQGFSALPPMTDMQGVNRFGARSPGLRSFSMDDLQMLKAAGISPHWHPQLASVPEGGPSLLPLPLASSAPATHTGAAPLPIPAHHHTGGSHSPGMWQAAGVSAGSSLSNSGSDNAFVRRSPVADAGPSALQQKLGQASGMPSHGSGSSLSSLGTSYGHSRRGSGDGHSNGSGQQQQQQQHAVLGFPASSLPMPSSTALPGQGPAANGLMRPMPGQSALSHVLAQNNHQHQQQQQHLAPQQGTAGGPAAGGRRWSGPGASFAPEQQQQQQQQDATTGPMPLYQHNLAAMRMPLSGTGGHMLTPPGLYTDGGAAASTSAAAAAPGMGMGMALPGGGSLPNTAAANSHAFSTTGASRGGLPLRKSQSAVELGNWRSMSANDMQAYEAAAAAAMAAAGHGKMIGRLTPEERLQRIMRYRAKRDLRNYNQSIKYQCRKSLADTRPRVGGRFARNDDPKSVMPHETKKAQRLRLQQEALQRQQQQQQQQGSQLMDQQPGSVKQEQATPSRPDAALAQAHPAATTAAAVPAAGAVAALSSSWPPAPAPPPPGALPGPKPASQPPPQHDGAQVPQPPAAQHAAWHAPPTSLPMPGSIQPTTNNNNNANTARAGGGGVLEPEQMQVLEDIAARLDSPLLEAFFDQVLDECGPASPQPLQQLPALPAGDAHGQQPMQQGV